MTLHQVSCVVIPREKCMKMGVQASRIVSMVTMRVKSACYSRWLEKPWFSTLTFSDYQESWLSPLPLALSLDVL